MKLLRVLSLSHVFSSRKAIFVSSLLATALVAALVAGGVESWREFEAKRLAFRAAELECLATNIYYESRGEPLVGQYAVAEVTMNRVDSAAFPDTVCEVVYATGRDRRTGTLSAAFSWTILDALPPREGLAWQRAATIAATVYGNREAPFVDGALFYHATYVVPDWSTSKERAARIGRHLFYY
jgi:N-acetylmuramoyl-L-alanine amidase